MADDIQRTGAPTVEEARFRQVLGHFCSGVTVVSAVDRGEPAGFTCQSFSSLSLDPPLVLICPGKTSSTLPHLRSAGTFCVNILAEDQEELSRVFATRGADKFKGLGWRPSHATGAPVLDGVLGWIDCRIEVEHDAGDHVILVGRVVDLGIAEEGSPLLFYRGWYGRFEP